MTTLTKDELDFFDPILEYVNYYGSQKEYLTKKKDSKGWLVTVNNFTDFINDYITKPSHPETLLQIKPLRLHYKKRMAKNNKRIDSNYYYVTISPDNDFPIKSVKSMMERIAKWSCWEPTQFIGVIEQRGHQENQIYGAHIHFLGLKSDKYAHSNVKQRIKNLNKHNLNVQVINNEKPQFRARDKQDYFFKKTGYNKKGIEKAKI